jgi:hypothetical protein
MNPTRHAVTLALAGLACASAHAQTQQTKPPIATYGMDVETRTMSIPGMPAGGLAGMMMPGGMGMGPTKELLLGLRSSQKPTGTLEAQHAIPPGMNMGASLPLLPPPPTSPGRYDDTDVPEKPKARMLIYWGCGDAVRPGQPKVLDTEKMSLEQFGKGLVSRAPPERWHAWRNAQYLWPNERERERNRVPPEASLRGDHAVRGSVTPEIRFAIGERHDFMPPLELATQGPLDGPVAVSWGSVANAQGYFLQAIGSRRDGAEMIIWTSSDAQDAGFGLLDYLPNDYVRRMINEKAVMPASTTRCTIPKGIFGGADGAMVNGIAYGEELNLAHPPRPADPKVAWQPVWAVKVRVKSTGMAPLGMDDEGGSRARDRGQRPARDAGTTPPPGQPQPQQAEKPASPLDEASDAVNKLKGLFRF